jgi:hypothetical protein
VGDDSGLLTYYRLYYLRHPIFVKKSQWYDNCNISAESAALFEMLLVVVVVQNTVPWGKLVIE